MRSLSLLANEWIKMGHEVTFLCHESTDKPYYPTIANIIYHDDNGLISLKPNADRRQTSHSIYASMFSLYRALNSIESTYDVGIATFYLTAYPLKFSKIKLKKFYYIQAYEPGFFSGKDRSSFMYKNIAKQSYNLGLKLVVNARSYYNYNEIKTSRLVLPPVDLGVFYPKLNPGKINPSNVKIGMIGRQIGWKGGDYVVRAFRALQIDDSTANNYQLHVAFGGEDLNQEKNTVIRCPNNDSELADFYREMDILVAVPTLQNGAVHYPVVEALACGTPLITTGYYPATYANSLQVPPHDFLAIKESIKEIIINPDIAVERSMRGLVDVQEYCHLKAARKFSHYFH